MSALRAQRHRLRAFGIAVELDWPLPGARPVDPSTPAAPEATTVRRVPSRELTAAWCSSAECVIDGRWLVEHARAGYQITCADPGRFIVSDNGTEILCELDVDAPHVQERFLVAQILPLAAVLRGFEAFHASAVRLDGGAVAFTGPSGVGKTTLVSHLMLRGADLLTDDVIALEPGPDVPLAHPGPPFVALVEEDLELVEAVGRLGSFAGTSDKLNVSLPTVSEPQLLRVIYHLERGPELEITPVGGRLVQRLLEGVFVPYLATPDRLRRQFEMAQLLGDRVGHFRLRVPPKTDFDSALEAVEAHAQEAMR